MKRYTLRCAICALNWPWHEHFRICPQCGEETASRELNTPSTINDHIMDIDEALAYLEENDIDSPLRTQRKRKVHVPLNIEKHVAELHADLDRWAHTTPDWMKR